MHTVDAENRAHAEVELANRDLKDSALARFPSGSLGANAAWTMIACLAHNLSRWVGQLGLEDETWCAARTIHRRLIALAGWLTRIARRFTLNLPARWPWRDAFVEALARIRALPAAAWPARHLPHPQTGLPVSSACQLLGRPAAMHGLRRSAAARHIFGRRPSRSYGPRGRFAYR